MNRPTRRQRLKLLTLAGFDIDFMKKPNEDPFKIASKSMTENHGTAIFITQFWAEKTDCYCYSELPTSYTVYDGKGNTVKRVAHRADAYILPGTGSPLGVAIQWEIRPSKKLKELNKTFFPDTEVITLDYTEYMKDKCEMTAHERLKKWLPRMQLPVYPRKFDWTEWWRQIKGLGVDL